MGRYEMNLLYLVMNSNENIKNELKLVEKSMGCTYKITHFFAEYCPRVTHFASYEKQQHFLGLVLHHT